MANITYELAGLRDELTDLIVDKVDLGAGANGTLVLLDSIGTVLSTINLDSVAFGASTGGTATATGLPKQDLAAAAAGTAVKAEVRDKDGTPVFSGDVSVVGGGAFAQIDSVTIAAGDVVTLQLLTFTTPAS